MGRYSDYVTSRKADKKDQANAYKRNQAANIDRVAQQGGWVLTPERQVQLETRGMNDIQKLEYFRDRKQQELDDFSRKDNYTSLWDAITTDRTIDDWKADRKRKKELSSELEELNAAQNYYEEQKRQEELSSMSTRELESKLYRAEHELSDTDWNKVDDTEYLTGKQAADRALHGGGRITNARKTILEMDIQKYRTELQRRSDSAMLDSVDEETKQLLAEYNSAKNDRSTATHDLSFAFGGSGGAINMNPVFANAGARQQESKQKLIDKGFTEKAIEDLAEAEKRKTDKAATEYTKEQAKKFGKEHPVIATVSSPFMTLASMAGSYHELQYSSEYNKDYNPESSLNWGYNAKTGMHEGVVDTFQDGILSKRTKAMLYDTGVSALDSLAFGLVPGGEVLLGMSAFNESLNQNMENGKSYRSALAGAVLAGIAEGAFEHLSIGNLKAFKEVGEGGIKNTVKNVAKSMAVNFSEEANTEIANIITDYLVNGGMSDFDQNVAKYVRQGLSEKEAKNRATKDAAKQVADAGVGGALMGGAFGVGGTAFQGTARTINRASTGTRIANTEGGIDRILTGATNLTKKSGQRTAEKVKQDQERFITAWAAQQTAQPPQSASQTAPRQGSLEGAAENEKTSPKNDEASFPFSLKKSTEGEKYVEVDRERAKDFDKNDGRSHAQIISEIIRDDFGGKIKANGQEITVNRKTNNEWTDSKSAKWTRANAQEVYNDKLKSFAHADELLTSASGWINESKKHSRKDNFTQFARGDVDYKVGGNGYSADVVVGLKEDGTAVLYDLVNIKNKALTEDSVNALEPPVGKTDEFFNQNIPQNKYSVKSSENNTVSPSQSEGKAPKRSLAQRYRIGKLAEMVDSQYSKDVEAAQKTVIGDRLRELGETPSGSSAATSPTREAWIEKVANAIYESFSGSEEGKIKAAVGSKTISNSKYGQRVLNELNDTEGRFTSGWKSNFNEKLAEINDRYTNGKNSGDSLPQSDSSEREPVKAPVHPAIETAIKSIEKVNNTSLSNFERNMAQGLFEKATMISGREDSEGFARAFEYAYQSGYSGNGLDETVRHNQEDFNIGSEITKDIYLLGEKKKGIIAEANAKAAADTQKVAPDVVKNMPKSIVRIAAEAINNGADEKLTLSAAEKVARYAAMSGKSFEEAKKSKLFQDISADLEDEYTKKIFSESVGLVSPVISKPKKVFTGKGRFTENLSTSTTEGMADSELSTIRTLLSALAETGHTNYRLVEPEKVSRDGKKGNGFFNPRTNTITVSSEAENLFTVVIHENVHAVAEGDQKAFLKLAGAARDFFISTSSEEDFIEQMMNMAELYDSFDRNLILEEFTASFIEGLFATDEGVSDFMSWLSNDSKLSKAEKKSVIQTIIDALTDFINRVKEILKSGGLSTATAKEAQKIAKANAERAEQVRQMFLDALDEINGNHSGSSAASSSTREAASDESMEIFEPDDLPFSLKEEKERYSEYDKPITRSDIQDLRTLFVHRKAINRFTSEEIQATQKWAHKYFKQMGVKSPFFRSFFGEWRAKDTTPLMVVSIPSVSADEFKTYVKAQRSQIGIENLDTKADDNSTGWMIKTSGQGERNTHAHSGEGMLSEKALTGIAQLIKNAVLLDSEAHEHQSNNSKTIESDPVAFDHRLYALGEDELGRINLYRITVEDRFQDKKHPNEYLFHNLKYIEQVASDIRKNEKAEIIRGRTGDQSRSHVSASLDASTSEFTISDLYSFVKQFDKEFNAGRPVSDALLNEDGTPKIVYHQTAADFTVFNTNNPVAAQYDSETPNGIFFKDNDHDIGIGGNRQMAVYLSIQKPLHFANRNEANRWYRSNIDGYAKLADEQAAAIKPISDEMDKIENRMFSDISEEEYDQLDRQWNELLEKMRETENNYSAQLRELLNDHFLKNDSGYDGIILDDDGHRWVNGKREDVHTFIAFKNTQVKSATDNIGTFDSGEEDIRFSLKVKHSNGTEELIPKVSELTDDQILNYVKQAKTGKIKGKSYIPVKRNTSATVVESLRASGYDVKDNPLVMLAAKASDSMSNASNAKKYTPHRLTPEQLIAILNNMDKPTGIVLQTGRMINGKAKPDNVAVFVSFDSGVVGEEEGVAIIEFDPFLFDSVVFDGGETDFNAVAAAFVPTGKNGETDYDYYERLLAREGNIDIKIIEQTPAESSHPGDTPMTKQLSPVSDNSLSQNAGSVNTPVAEPSSVSGDAAATFPQSGEGKTSEDLLEEAREKLSLQTVPELMNENKSLIRRNRQLENKLRNVEYTVKGAKFTFQVDLKKVDSVARVFIKQYGSRADAKSVADKIAEAYNLMINGKDTDRQNRLLSQAADEIIENIKQEKVVDDFHQEILDNIKRSTITLSDEQKNETAYHFGSYGAFRKSLFGRANIGNEGTPLDILWAQWSDSYPSIFDPTIPDVDQPSALKDIIDTIKEGYIEDIDTESMKDFLIEELREGITQVPKSESITGKEKEKLRELHLKLRSQLKDIKADYKNEYETRLKEAKKRMDITFMGTERERQRLEETRARILMRQEAREQTATRAAYRKQLVRDIKRLDRMVRSPKLQTGVAPEHLRSPIADLLSAFTDDTSVFTYKQLDAVSRAYNSIKTTAAADISEDVRDWIEEIKDTVDGKRLSELNEKQLAKVHDIVNYFIKLVQSENEIFKDGKWQLIRDLGQSSINELNNTKNKKIFKGKGFFFINNLTPVYAFKKMGGTLNSLFGDIREGQNTYVRNAVKAHDFFETQYREFNTKKWANDKHDFTTERGDELSFTTEQLLTVYATFKRELANPKNSSHLMAGGIVFKNQLTKDKKTGKYKVGENETSYQLTIQDLVQLSDMLTKEQKSFADAMVKYLSEDMSELGNEVSMELLGFKKFTESYYFPFNTSSSYRHQSFSNTDDDDIKLKNIGFTKETQFGAKTPLVVDDFTNVWTNHVERMIAYNAYVIPIENFTKVWNYQFKAEPAITGEDGKTVSLKAVFQNVHGKDMAKYVSQFMKDLNGGTTTDSRETVAAKFTSFFKRNAVLLNASVAIQQPSAIMRATAYINPKYFVASSIHKPMASFEEAKKYSSAARLKEIGGYDVGMSAGMTSWIGEEKKTADPKLRRAQDKLSEISGWAPEKADAIAWGHIWEAAKRETAARTGLSGEALLKETAKRFDEVIDLTQVYDSTFVRSSHMRNKSPWAKMLTAFMAEPTVNLNMLQDAFTEHKGDRRFAAAAVASVASAMILNSLLKAIVSAARHGKDDETYLETYLSDFISNLFDEANPLSMIPFVKDVLSIFSGYDVTRSDMAAFADFKKDLETVIDLMQDIGESDNKAWDAAKIVGNSLVPVAKAFGIPIDNLNRDVWAVIDTASRAGNGNKTNPSTAWNAVKEGSFPLSKSILKSFGLIKDETKGDKIYRAWLEGDDEMFNRLAGQYSGAKAIRSQLSSHIKDDYVNGVLDYDQAYTLLESLNYDKIDEKISGWTEEKEQQEEGSTPITLDNFTDELENGGTVSRGDQLYEAWLNNDSSTYNEVAATYSSGTGVKTSLSNHIKSDYLDGNISYDEAYSRLQRLGYEKIDEKISGWTEPKEQKEDKNADFLTLG